MDTEKKPGGQVTLEKYGPEHFSKISGGSVTFAKYGPAFMAAIGSKGGKKSKRGKARRKQDTDAIDTRTSN